MLTRRDVIALAALGLLTLGVVMVNSAGMGIAPVDPSRPVGSTDASVTLESIVTSRTTLYAAVAVLVLLVASRLPVGWIDRLASLRGRSLAATVTCATLAIVALLSAVYWPVVGKTVNGAQRWVRVPVIEQFQPSEIAKWAVIPLLACAAVALGERIRSTLTGSGPLLLIAAVISGMIVLEDLGTAVLIAGVCVMLLLAAGMRAWFLAAVTPVAAGAFGFAVLSSPYRVDRVVSFIDPFRDPAGDGYHMIQSMATIAGGGPFGRGLGHGLQKFGYLPEDTTDFVFAVICEELGLAGATLVLVVYGLLFVALAGVVRQAATRAARLVSLGVLLTLVGQTTINLFVVTGLGPTKGIALPLLSSGGTGWVLIGLALGTVMAIDRAAERSPASGHDHMAPFRATTARA